MTIASQISRLQTAKSCLKASIEWKWVTVWNVSLSCYYKCVDAIEQGWWDIFVKALWVWWGWGWDKNYFWRWGGWWEVINAIINAQDTMCIIIWSWWASNTNWWDTKIWNLTVKWWKSWNNWGTSWSWCSWWGGTGLGWGGWWWASANWSNWHDQYYWWSWWAWLYWYWWWWGGWSYHWWWNWCDWWWNWWTSWAWSNATCYGWWGWWNGNTDSVNAGSWCKWLVEICYKTDWSCGFCTATWWNSCFTCNWYKVHRFTSNWTFTIVS